MEFILLPRLCEDLAPVAFRARETPEDFEVNERPAYEPLGEGEHLHLWVEKRGLTTEALVARLVRALDRPRVAFGFAGRKDRHALTRQWISVQGADPARALALELPGARVLRAVPHPRKLRRGRLVGNHFRLRLRGVASADRARLEASLERLAELGLPNAFGSQRFGRSGRGPELGRLLVEGRLEAYLERLASEQHAGPGPGPAALREALASGSRGALRRAARVLDPDLARVARQLERRRGDFRSAVRALGGDLLSMHLSSLQALAFQQVLAARMAEGPAALGALRAGDLAWDHALGRALAFDDPRASAARAAAFELSPSGPLPGARGELAEGAVGELERALCTACGAPPEAFAGLGLGLRARGARRPLRVPLAELELGFEGPDATLAFALPAGSFATALLAELGGTPQAGKGPEPDPGSPRAPDEGGERALQ